MGAFPSVAARPSPPEFHPHPSHSPQGGGMMKSPASTKLGCPIRLRKFVSASILSESGFTELKGQQDRRVS